jgi:hypothetical protein
MTKHKRINAALRRARGIVMEVSTGVPDENKAMGEFVRRSTGHSKPRTKKEIDKIKRAGVEQGYLLDDDCETILYDSRPGKTGTKQQKELE